MYLAGSLYRRRIAWQDRRMARTDRLLALTALLRDGAHHRAEDLAASLGVSLRTIYRDMDRLAAAGVPVEGRPGAGYRLAERLALPPLDLTPEEFDALSLGVAIVAQAADPVLKAAAQSLTAKLEAALPAETIAEAEAWKHAFNPLADPARGLSHLADLRSAIGARQKLRIAYAGNAEAEVIRPLRLASTGGAWVLSGWSDTADAFRDLRVDLIERATPLPELFVDEPGKRLRDRQTEAART